MKTPHEAGGSSAKLKIHRVIVPGQLLPRLRVRRVVHGRQREFDLGFDSDQAAVLAGGLVERIHAGQGTAELEAWLDAERGRLPRLAAGPASSLEDYHKVQVATKWLEARLARAARPAKPVARPAGRRGLGRKGTVFKPVNAQGQPSTCWCTRVTFAGRRVVFSLSEARERALVLNQDLRGRLRAGQPRVLVEAWLQRERHGPGPAVPTVAGEAATLRMLIGVHLDLYSPDASPDSLHGYRRTLLKAVEVVYCFRAGHVPVRRAGPSIPLEAFAAYLDLPCTILDAGFLDDYCAARLAGMPPEGEARRRRECAIASEIVAMRCMFSKAARLAYARAGLDLGHLDSFQLHPGFAVKSKRRPALPEDEVASIHAAFLELTEGDDLMLVVVIALALFGGLRCAEILHAHTTWLTGTTGPTIRVQRGRGFVPKFSHERTIELPRWLYALLRQLPPGYLLGPGSRHSRYRAILRAHLWLTLHGLGPYSQRLHRLRAYFAGARLEVAGSDFGQVRRAMGHGALRTTTHHYAPGPLSSLVAARWAIVPPRYAALASTLDS